MEQAGFQNVYQLDGGILKYFEECGGEFYDGECFVFDKRVALDPTLEETSTSQCYACQHPLTDLDQESELYVVGKSCPYCHQPDDIQQAAFLDQRNREIQTAVRTLPGSVPYDNHRPLNVPLRFEGLPVAQFLFQYHPHVDADYWLNEVQTGRILYKDQPVSDELRVWAGQRLIHLLKGTIEPEVNADIRLIYEDADLIAVNKPAPLPMHPCGRFNRNTLVYIINSVFQGEKIRTTHRLDAATTGVVVLARKRQVAQRMQSKFENGMVKKVYLARISGIPIQEEFSCQIPISGTPGERGIRLPAAPEEGLKAHTEFRWLHGFRDGTSLVQCMPRTGRTNQIRIHLWQLGHPIVNDPSYLIDGQLGNNRTPAIDDAPMYLHAAEIEFLHPSTDQPIKLVAEPPQWSQHESRVDGCDRVYRWIYRRPIDLCPAIN